MGRWLFSSPRKQKTCNNTVTIIVWQKPVEDCLARMLEAFVPGECLSGDSVHSYCGRIFARCSAHGFDVQEDAGTGLKRHWSSKRNGQDILGARASMDCIIILTLARSISFITEKRPPRRAVIQRNNQIRMLDRLTFTTNRRQKWVVDKLPEPHM